MTNGRTVSARSPTPPMATGIAPSSTILPLTRVVSHSGGGGGSARLPRSMLRVTSGRVERMRKSPSTPRYRDRLNGKATTSSTAVRIWPSPHAGKCRIISRPNDSDNSTPRTDSDSWAVLSRFSSHWLAALQSEVEQHGGDEQHEVDAHRVGGGCQEQPHVREHVARDTGDAEQGCRSQVLDRASHAGPGCRAPAPARRPAGRRRSRAPRAPRRSCRRNPGRGLSRPGRCAHPSPGRSRRR